MALSNPFVTGLTDSIAKAISDYNAGFITGTATPASNITAGVAGTGASATYGRVGALETVPDYPDLVALIQPFSVVATQVTAFLASQRSLNPFYVNYFTGLNALDIAAGGLNAFLVAAGIQVNGYAAAAFNYFAANATSLGLRTTAPIALSPATFFPWAAVDNMWGFTVSGATTFSSNAVGANANTSSFGGGVGQIYIYKNNAGNAAAGSTFTISYVNAAGTTVTATYTTAGGAPAASGSLSAGYAVPGAIGSAIVGVSGAGMTSGEQYTLGIQLVRAPGY